MTTSRLQLFDGGDGAELQADPARVAAQLTLPGDGLAGTRSRAAGIVDRVLALSPTVVAESAAAIVADFGGRHAGLSELLALHSATVASRSPDAVTADLTPDQTIVVGAAFTMEYAVEGAALCNPSAVPHPDQRGLEPGELRVAVALRGIGEGHRSSIGFATAVVGPHSWTFDPRALPVSSPTVAAGEWSRTHFRTALEHEGHFNELSASIVARLPTTFLSGAIDEAIRALPAQLTQRPDLHGTLDPILTMARSAYVARFDPSTHLSQRVLLPVAAEESDGIEDARFVAFQHEDGTSDYRATYTAYDGRHIAPRLIISADLQDFSIHRLTGSAAVNKGMAIFPRRIGADLVALTRTDGENITLARSADGLVWTGNTTVYGPDRLWSIFQTGNCGSPIETDRGWLVPIHGVGPMRVYSIGMILLDLDDPSRVLAVLDEPLIRPDGELREGYVPNVAYSCGAIAHDGVLWLPYGVGDARIRVGSVEISTLLDAMTPAQDPAS